jgi:hypothetical protein
MSEPRNTLAVRPESSNAERLEHLQRDRWIPYPAAIKVLTAMEDVLASASIPGGKIRPPCLLITAPSHQGKTSVLDAFYSRHLPDANATGENSLIPVLKVQTPNKPLEGRVLAAMLDALRVPYKQDGRLEVKMNALLNALRLCLVRLIILDEIHFALACTALQQATFGNLLRYISNELRISIVAVGTEEAPTFVNSQSNLKTRFRTVQLPVWINNDDLGTFLERFERTLPLKQRSNLARPELRSKVYDLSRGITGNIVNLITRAAGLAIRTGEERISISILEQAMV